MQHSGFGRRSPGYQGNIEESVRSSPDRMRGSVFGRGLQSVNGHMHGSAALSQRESNAEYSVLGKDYKRDYERLLAKVEEQEKLLVKEKI
jgi:hypothetical protein